ncbi:MAG: UvrD-helicase domain-containing protein [Sphaerochaeta sp.]|nr:UvrD-helicase domain-containing protein [Sphaerochaeta sp.]
MKIKVTTGLAGTGKSYEMYKAINDYIHDNENDHVMVLSFNRALKEKAMSELEDCKRCSIHTIHSLSYDMLKYFMRLPKAFQNLASAPDQNASCINGEKGKFDTLIHKALQLCIKDPASIRKYFQHRSPNAIFIDEFQDLRRDYVELVFQISSIMGTKQVILMGDPNQKIYEYLNAHAKDVRFKGLPYPTSTSIEDNFSKVTELFHAQKEDISNSCLNICRRSTLEIQQAINHFLSGNGGIQGDLYYKLDGQQPSGDKAKVRIFTTKEEEFIWVCKEVSNLPAGADILIVSQYNHVLKMYESLVTQAKEQEISLDLCAVDEMAVTTIHRQKGLEADFVFLVGVQGKEVLEKVCQDEMLSKEHDHLDIYNLVPQADTGITDVIYTGMSRAKKQLSLSTSYPNSPLEVFSTCSHICFSDTRNAVAKSWKRFPVLSLDRNFTLDKLKKSSIDSLIINVRDVDAPFLRYVPKGNIPKDKGKFQKGFVGHERGVPVTVIRNNGKNGSYQFEMLDLNPLKKRGYSDIQILRHCMNYVLKFFDERIDPGKMEIARLDIALYRQFNDASEAKAVLNSFYAGIDHSKINSVKDNSGNAYSVVEGKRFKSWGIHTLYLNFHANKHGKKHPCVYRIYNTNNKNRNYQESTEDRNQSGYTKRNCWKVEWKLTSSVLRRNYALKGNNNCRSLMESLQRDDAFLLDLYKSISNHFNLHVGKIFDIGEGTSETADTLLTLERARLHM